MQREVAESSENVVEYLKDLRITCTGRTSMWTGFRGIGCSICLGSCCRHCSEESRCCRVLHSHIGARVLTPSLQLYRLPRCTCHPGQEKICRTFGKDLSRLLKSGTCSAARRTSPQARLFQDPRAPQQRNWEDPCQNAAPMPLGFLATLLLLLLLVSLVVAIGGSGSGAQGGVAVVGLFWY